MGLDRLHQLTNSTDYKLNITLTDFDSKQYVAIYEDFKVRQSFLSAVLLFKDLVRAKVVETTSKVPDRSAPKGFPFFLNSWRD